MVDDREFVRDRVDAGLVVGSDLFVRESVAFEVEKGLLVACKFGGVFVAPRLRVGSDVHVRLLQL